MPRFALQWNDQKDALRLTNNYFIIKEINLPKGEVAALFVCIDEKLLTRTTWPETMREFEEDLGVHHHVTFLYSFCFPSLSPRINNFG